MRAKLGKVLKLGVVLIAFFAGCATTQGRVIMGVVMDNNNRPIGGAIVTTDPPTSSVATDNLGRYLLRLEKVGIYSVQANILGYVSDPVTVEVKSKDITQADLKLLPEGMAPASKTIQPVPVVNEGAKKDTSASSEEPENKPKKKWWEK
jgi:hypothetical protein